MRPISHMQSNLRPYWACRPNNNIVHNGYILKQDFSVISSSALPSNILLQGSNTFQLMWHILHIPHSHVTIKIYVSQQIMKLKNEDFKWKSLQELSNWRNTTTTTSMHNMSQVLVRALPTLGSDPGEIASLTPVPLPTDSAESMVFESSDFKMNKNLLGDSGWLCLCSRCYPITY